MKRTRKAGSTGDDNNLENEFKRWYTENQGRSEDTVRNYVNALNNAPDLVEKLTGKKPASVFVIFEPNQFEDNYDILFRIKDWDGKPGKDLNDIKDKCLPETSDERISEIWRTKLKQNDPDTNERTNSGSLSAALGKYMDFLAFIWSRIPRNRIHFGAPGTGKSHQLKEAVEGKLDKDGKVIQDVEHNIGFFVDVDKDKKIGMRRYERVTFYPTYSYAQFVGCYKPVMEWSGTAVKERSVEKNPEILSEDELAARLKTVYKTAKNSDDENVVLSVLLFAETYVSSFNKKITASSVVKKSGIPKGAYSSWLNAGLRLAKEHLHRGENKGNEGNEHEDIAYKFIPGPFLRVLVKALNNPGNHYCLVIEEINRANAAAVFGDVFQLLDRDSKSGESEYDIAASEDVKKFLYEDKEGLTKAGKETLQRLAGEGRLKIPSNMYIWATMNSADQGVFPMDTAFKRRWEFEYVDIDKGSDGKPSGWEIAGPEDVNGKAYKWNEVRMFINALLSQHGVNEDKLLGPWFVKPENDTTVSDKQFKSKVLMYLWEDAGRMCRKELFGGSIRTYAALVDQWGDSNRETGSKRGIAIFEKDAKKDNLNDNLKQWYQQRTTKSENADKPVPMS